MGSEGPRGAHNRVNDGDERHTMTEKIDNTGRRTYPREYPRTYTSKAPPKPEKTESKGEHK